MAQTDRKNYFLQYNKTHAERRRKKQRVYYSKIRTKVLELLGNQCKRCGFSDPRALQVDHVNGGGVKETESMTRMFMKYVAEEIAKGSKKYQLLCANCNWIKKAENNEITKRRIYK